jgi:hypothetical protein
VVAYLSYFGYLMVKLDPSTDALLRTITIVIAVCSIVAMLGMAAVWIKDYLLETREPVRVLAPNSEIWRKCRRRELMLMTDDTIHC